MRGALVLIVPFVLAGTTTPAGPVGAPIELGGMLREADVAGLSEVAAGGAVSEGAAAGEPAPGGVAAGELVAGGAAAGGVAAGEPAAGGVAAGGAATHRKRFAFGTGAAGEAEVTWRTAASKEGPYVAEVALAVIRPVDGVEVLAPVVLPALEGATKDNPLGGVGVVVGWRKESACGTEQASTTYQIDAQGGWKAL